VLISKTNNSDEVNINLRNNPIQQVKEFCYLGNRNQATAADVKRRIALAKKAFSKSIIYLVIDTSNWKLVKSLLKLLYGVSYVTDVRHGQRRRKIRTIYKQWRCGCGGR